MAVASAEVAEGFLVCEVHLHVDALAVAVHGGWRGGVMMVLLMSELVQKIIVPVRTASL
jgi:hypothetical protein